MYETFSNYKYIMTNSTYPYEVLEESTVGVTNTEIVVSTREKLNPLNVIAVSNGMPNVEVVDMQGQVNGNIFWVSETVNWLDIGDEVDVMLENGENIQMVVGGKYKTKGPIDENFGGIVDFEVIKGSLYNEQFNTLYSNEHILGFDENSIDLFVNSPTFDIQVSASLLLGAIAIILSIVALFNTFAVIMSVRKKEFSGLKLVGAEKTQILKMVTIETLIVTSTGIVIGIAILIACVGTYSLANLGSFDFIVNKQLFFGSCVLSFFLSFISSLLPSIITIWSLKRKFRNE